MKDNKIIIKIDLKYRSMLSKIIINHLRNVPPIPLEWQDIYYSFLATVPQLIREYEKKGNNSVPFKTYLGIKCKNFTRNKCKSYNRRKFRILNKAIYDPDLLLKQENKDYNILSDSEKVDETPSFNINKLTYDERVILNLFIYKNKPAKEVSKLLNMSIYKFNKTAEKILDEFYKEYYDKIK